jgi:hypothetical protein
LKQERLLFIGLPLRPLSEIEPQTQALSKLFAEENLMLDNVSVVGNGCCLEERHTPLGEASRGFRIIPSTPRQLREKEKWKERPDPRSGCGWFP